MNFLIRFLPFLVSAIICAVLAKFSNDFWWMIIILPGFIYGTALAILGQSLPGFSPTKAILLVVISGALNSVVFLSTYFTWGLLGSPLGAAAAFVLGLLTFRFQADLQVKKIWILPLAGFLSWWVFYIPNSLQEDGGWLHPYVLVYFIWQVLVGLGIVYIQSISTQEQSAEENR